MICEQILGTSWTARHGSIGSKRDQDHKKEHRSENRQRRWFPLEVDESVSRTSFCGAMISCIAVVVVEEERC